MKALKEFLDGKQRRIKAGQELPSDYDKGTLAHYRKVGLIGGGDEEAEAKAKLAKKTSKKTK